MILRSSFFSVLIFIRSAYVKSCVVISVHCLLLSWSFVLFISRNHLETWLTNSCLEDLTIFISWLTMWYTHLRVQNNSFSEMIRKMTITMKMKMTTRRNLVDWWERRMQMSFWILWLAKCRWSCKDFMRDKKYVMKSM